jgi:hypothetical protein
MDCFQILAVVNNEHGAVSLNMRLYTFFKDSDLISFGYLLRNGWLGHMAVIFLTFQELPNHFPMAILISIPPKKKQFNGTERRQHFQSCD